jgi:hypothetical protein
MIDIIENELSKYFIDPLANIINEYIAFNSNLLCFGTSYHTFLCHDRRGRYNNEDRKVICEFVCFLLMKYKHNIQIKMMVVRLLINMYKRFQYDFCYHFLKHYCKTQFDCVPENNTYDTSFFKKVKKQLKKPNIFILKTILEKFAYYSGKYTNFFKMIVNRTNITLRKRKIEQTKYYESDAFSPMKKNSAYINHSAGIVFCHMNKINWQNHWAPIALERRLDLSANISILLLEDIAGVQDLD